MIKHIKDNIYLVSDNELVKKFLSKGYLYRFDTGFLYKNIEKEEFYRAKMIKEKLVTRDEREISCDTECLIKFNLHDICKHKNEYY